MRMDTGHRLSTRLGDGEMAKGEECWCGNYRYKALETTHRAYRPTNQPVLRQVWGWTI